MTSTRFGGLVEKLKRYAPARVDSDGCKPGGTGVRAVLLTCVLVGAVVAGGVGGALASSSTSAAPPNPPSGMVGVGDANVQDLRPEGVNAAVQAADLEGAVYTSAHAETTRVSLVTRGQAQEVGAGADPAAVAGEAVCGSPAAGKNPAFECGQSFALVVQDDVHDAGREVAIRADVLKAGLGYVPQSLTVQNNETGETWTGPATLQDGYLVADFEHFSSNSVTYSGTVSLSGDPAQDETAYSYYLEDVDAVEDGPTLNLTGVVTEEWDNETMALGDGENAGVAFAGTESLAGPSTNGLPTATLTAPAAHSTTDSTTKGDIDSGYTTEINYSGDTIERLTVDVGTVDGGDEPDHYDVYLEGELIDDDWDVYNEKTTTWEGLNVSVDGDSATLQFDSDNQGGSYWYWDYAGSTISKPGGATAVTLSADDGTSVDVGDIGSGGSKTVEFPVSLSASQVSLSQSKTTTLGVNVHAKERVGTGDVGIGVNTDSGGGWVNVTWPIADGETVSREVNASWVQDGVNQLDVRVGDGSLSADAPTPGVGLDYSHAAVDNVSVSYTAEAWTERYNITRSWGDATDNATLTVPFASDVVLVRNLETRVDGGSWEDVAASAYSFDGTALTVDFGDLPGRATTDVRVEGATVKPVNGSINVLEPTMAGNGLSTRFEVASTSGEFGLDVSGTSSAGWLHYLENETWTDTQEYARVESDAQTLVMPNAGEGARLRARIWDAPLGALP
ncbi:hypothetical protein [Halobacterium wangiae]|uniref:hypothetical protein n=1 Tax=Halobacterium wangiae TaxID=2902623 RepID=UPI001E5A9D73|nr:hypothetical protein [Halobacterium wangiae]